MTLRRTVRSAAVAGFLGVAALTHGADAGWKTGMELTIESAHSLRGGAESGDALHSLALARVEWQQPETPKRSVLLHFYASALNLAGRGPTGRFVRDFLAASNIEGPSSTRLYSWWLEAQSGDGSLRVGALLADEEFTGTEVGGNFFNSAFGWPAFISANTVNTGPAFYVAALGARFEHRVGESGKVRLGVFDGDTFDSAAGDPAVNRHGVHYRLGGAQGWFAIGEAALAPGKGPTRFKAGAWLHTADFADVRDDSNGRRLAASGAVPRNHGRNYGAYAAVEHTLSGKQGAPGHVAAHVRAGASPVDRNTLGWSLDSGVASTGWVPGRATDITALGLAWASFSPRFAANARTADPLSPAPDFEQVIELCHSAVISEHLTVQPDVQYIRHPGGSAARRDALVLLLRLKASF